MILTDPHLCPEGRVGKVASESIKSRKRLDQLIELAAEGLPQFYSSGSFAHTLRLASPQSVRMEGDNLRYSAIVALGANSLDETRQRCILGGRTAAEYSILTTKQAARSDDLGAVALSAWAAAETANFYASSLFERLADIESIAQIETVICSWTLSAAIAAKSLGDTTRLMEFAARLLQRNQAASGLFPHILPEGRGGLGRKHVTCFADQVYPIQALSRLAIATEDKSAVIAAEKCAACICKGQGQAGQWWWHYDYRFGRVVEGYPVYSVHQHAMGPMALFELQQAGGANHLPSIVRGLQWLDQRPETEADLVENEHKVIWRKVGRREFAKIVRRMSAIMSWVGIVPRGIDTIFPPNRVDYECRPYELGWLLYAWLSDAAVARIKQPGALQMRHRTEHPIPCPTKQPMFGFQFDALRIDDVVEVCRQAVTTRRRVLLGVMNAAKVVSARRDRQLNTALLQCDLLLADGQSVVWASRLLRRPLPERVAGIDVFERLLAMANDDGRSVYLLGATPVVVQALVTCLQSRFPRLKIVGYRNGYFSDGEAAAIAKEICEASPDFLFLGMPSPKKEIFLSSFGSTLNVPVVHGVGGSFDVLAGLTKRAPLMWQRFGMEWAFRLLQEPRRLWRRYLTTNFKFILLTAAELFRRPAST